MTIGAIVICGVVTLGIIAFCGIWACGCFERRNSGGAIAVILAGIVLVGCLWGGTLWYYNNTASGSRALRDQQSELSNGYKRTITVMEADGNVVYTYTGKIDIETDNETGYILFDDENGERHIIYKGVTQMILIEDN